MPLVPALLLLVTDIIASSRSHRLPAAPAAACRNATTVYFAEFLSDDAGGILRAFVTTSNTSNSNCTVDETATTITSVSISGARTIISTDRLRAWPAPSAAAWLSPGFRDTFLKASLPRGVSWVRALPNPMQPSTPTEVAVRFCVGVDSPGLGCIFNNGSADIATRAGIALHVHLANGQPPLVALCRTHAHTTIETIAFEPVRVHSAEMPSKYSSGSCATLTFTRTNALDRGSVQLGSSCAAATQPSALVCSTLTEKLSMQAATPSTSGPSRQLAA
eukprot:COSAG01_NODE_9588_length_2399_cov_16.890870_1_plen_276_part_00